LGSRLRLSSVRLIGQSRQAPFLSSNNGENRIPTRLIPRLNFCYSHSATRRGLVVLLYSLTVACGGSTADSKDASAIVDASTDAGAFADGNDAGKLDDDASNDAGTFPCGDAECTSSQICLTPAYGCTAADLPVLPVPGVCTGGWEYSDSGFGGCVPSPSCVISGVPGGTYNCSGGDAGANCQVSDLPFPSYCSRYCSQTCS
jgi:hypothetical protein